MVKDFISLLDFSEAEVAGFLDFADELKALQKAGTPHELLKGKSLALIFEKPSLRTRVTFQIGMFQLGGSAVLLETRLGERESVPDVARNLDRWVDAIAARTFSHAHLVELGALCRGPVVNMLTDRLHPCQILADAQALREHRGKDLSSLKLVFIGDGNNVFHSWAELAARMPLDLTLICPPQYLPDMELVAACRAEAKGNITVTHDIDSVRDADVIYTDVWASMGQEEEEADRAKVFAPYQVNGQLMARAKRDCLFLHCLPAHRGLEVTDDVMDSPNSIVFDQAENRLHAQKAILATLMR